MSSSDLPKFWTEPTKIGSIFLVRFDQFLMLKNDFENYDFLYLCQDAHNFGKSDDDII